jgi:hypothetical protein
VPYKNVYNNNSEMSKEKKEVKNFWDSIGDEPTRDTNGPTERK